MVRDFGNPDSKGFPNLHMARSDASQNVRRMHGRWRPWLVRGGIFEFDSRHACFRSLRIPSIGPRRASQMVQGWFASRRIRCAHHAWNGGIFVSTGNGRRLFELVHRQNASSGFWESFFQPARFLRSSARICMPYRCQCF